MTPGLPLIEVAVFGLSSGAVIGLLAVGLVLVYRTTGVFNIAQWAIGLVAVVAYALLARAGVAAPLAALAALPVAAAAGIGGFRLAISPLRARGPLVTILVAIGVAQLYVSAAGLILGFERFTRLPPWLPVREWRLGSAVVRSTDIVTAVAGIAVALGFLVWFRASRTGRALRALAQNREAAVLAGIDEPRTSRLAWGISSALAGLALLLVLPHSAGAQGGLLTPFDLSPLGSLLVPAFGAALVGGLVNLPMALVGGILFGIVRDLLILAPPPWSGLRASMATILIVVLLLSRADRLFVSGHEVEALER